MRGFKAVVVEDDLNGDDRAIRDRIEGRLGRARLREITRVAEKARIDRKWRIKVLVWFEAKK